MRKGQDKIKGNWVSPLVFDPLGCSPSLSSGMQCEKEGGDR